MKVAAAPATMAAVLFHGKEQLSIGQVPRPECGPRDVLLQVAACGICGGDVRSYYLSDAFTGMSRIPGHEPAGIVIEAGAEVTDWKPGDRIALAADIHCGHCFYCRRELFNMCDDLKVLGKHVTGAIADYFLVEENTLRNGIVNRIPDQVPMLHAALSEPLCSVLASHDALNVRPGETVLIMGAGPMGILHHLLLHARAARTILADMSMSRLERARNDFGAEYTFDASEKFEATLRDLCGGAGPDVVIVAAPSAAAVERAITLVRKRGRVGLFGGLPADQAQVPLDINRIHYGEISLIGNFSYHPRYHRRALEVLSSGLLPCDKLITKYRVEDTRRALEDVRFGRVTKAVVTPNGGSLV